MANCKNHAIMLNNVPYIADFFPDFITASFFLEAQGQIVVLTLWPHN